jgi:hypothetical protein
MHIFACGYSYWWSYPGCGFLPSSLAQGQDRQCPACFHCVSVYLNTLCLLHKLQRVVRILNTLRRT